MEQIKSFLNRIFSQEEESKTQPEEE